MTEYITKEQAAEIAHTAAKQAIKETFALMGVNAQDFDSMERFRDDLDWVRRYRKTSESVSSKVAMTILTIVTGGVVYSFYEWLHWWLKR